MSAPAPASANAAEEAAQLVRCALAFEHKLHGMADDLDPEWQEALQPQWGFLDELHSGAARRQALVRVLGARLGGLPALRRLLEPAPQLALLDRPSLLKRLCILALARRPGMLRCCIERPVRHALQSALGDDFDTLVALSRSGSPYHHESIGWSPMEWACTGYFDWATMLLDDDAALRRIVRLSLPRGLLHTIDEYRPVPAQIKPIRALGALAEAGLAWPC
jgi:hypothetical protein